MIESSAEFVLKLLAEQKLNQVNIQCFMQETKNLIQKAVKHKLNYNRIEYEISSNFIRTRIVNVQAKLPPTSPNIREVYNHS